MDTNRLKKFAAEARNILIRGVKQRLSTLGFSADGSATEEPQQHDGGATFMGKVVSNDFYTQWMSLQRAIQQRGIKDVAEEAAYTWFNRLVAIRILVKNGLIAPVLAYESENVRIPVLVSEARQGRLPQMDAHSLRQWEEIMNDDSQTDRQFALLIVAFCHATPILQKCFGRISDYTELLLPANILSEGGLVDLLNHTPFISEEDYRSPELIGWLYQFYISEKKNEVFAKNGKFEADEIPAATQIFTPNWIVKYMVQNTVGRIYLDNNPYSEIKETMQYLVEPEEPATEDTMFRFDDIHELTCADLACGSGHILNECFDLLYQCYMEEGYSRRQAVEDIFRYNLTGIDLDTRAKQLATFSLLLKACQKDSSFVDAHCLPRIMDMPVVNRYTYKDLDGHFCCAYGLEGPGSHAYKELEEAFTLMEQADSLGSIMKFEISDDTRVFIRQCVEAYEAEPKYTDRFRPLIEGYRLILSLTEKYAALVMNPPYMGGGNMNDVLSQYVKKNYKEGKTDLFSVFMLLAIDRLKQDGKYGMINMQSWMFLSSFEKLRNRLLNENRIDNMLHLGPHTFDELSGEVVQNTAFVVTKATPNDIGGTYFRLVDGINCSHKEDIFLAANFTACTTSGVRYRFDNVSQKDFEKIPGCPIGYWVSPKIQEVFTSNLALSEVSQSRIGFGCENAASAARSQKKWFPYNKGGDFRRWYGFSLSENIINWYNDGEELKNFQPAVIRNPNYYFKEGISFPRIGSNLFYARTLIQGFVFDCNGPSCFPSKDKEFILGLLNSRVMQHLLFILCPTLSFQIGDSFKVAYIESPNYDIAGLVQSNISISKQDWDAHETSWDFETSPLLAVDENTYMDNIQHYIEEREKETGEHLCIDPAAPELDSLEWRLAQYKQQWEQKFMQLHANEEELNRQFIDIYGLQDELTPDVPLQEVTILQQGEITIED